MGWGLTRWCCTSVVSESNSLSQYQQNTTSFSFFFLRPCTTRTRCRETVQRSRKGGGEWKDTRTHTRETCVNTSPDKHGKIVRVCTSVRGRARGEMATRRKLSRATVRGAQ